MTPEQSIAIMKALADQSRLAIINSLLERSQYVEEIAKRHGLAPSTVSFHLKKLEQAGLVMSRKEQYYVVIQANNAIFDITLREIVAAPTVGKELQDGRMAEYRSKVLDTFFRNGRFSIGSSTNRDGTRNSRMFQLRTGKAVFNKELQKDLTEFDAGSFEFFVLNVLAKPEPGDNVERLCPAS